jgi:hypothetical protein
MESLMGFAKSDVGAILGGVLIVMGITGYALFQHIMLPKLREYSTENAAKNVNLLDKLSKIELIVFCVAGATLLYLHFRG